MNLYKNLKYWIESKFFNIRHSLEVAYYKRKYPDYEDNYCNIGSLKLIWGIKSWDDLTGADTNLYSMNDIDITYDRKSKLYMLGIETAYMFDDHESECKYLRQLLEAFTSFMSENGYSTDCKFPLFFGNPSITTSAESIEELYTNFRIFVEGYCKVYEIH